MAKIALFFLLDSTSLPDNFGMKLSVESTAPFYDPVMRDIRLTKLAYTESTAYCLRLFKKPFAKDVLVIVKDLEYHTGGKIVESCCRQAEEILKFKSDKPFYHEEYLYRSMWLPRGVQKHEFETLVNSFSGKSDIDIGKLCRLDSRGSWIMDHPDGYIFGTKNENDFLRSVVFYALAMSYHHTLSDAANRLSLAMCTPGEQLVTMLRDVARFNGSYYFRNPVKAGARADAREYDHLVKRFNFTEMEQILASKVASATTLVNLRHSESGHAPVPHAHPADAMAAEVRYPREAPPQQRQSSGFGRWLLILLLLVAIAGGAMVLLGSEDPVQMLQQLMGHSNDVTEPTLKPPDQ